ncbi:hypothetical protein [Acrocarpospora catenulata]|uniref:hypothetical protein n=1 Tax=Acrocarpospora catenulata TaxID=2836182 RepID=UPI001BD97E2B|nr:hypothetical protein [Acrocarpospora catenulata]
MTITTPTPEPSPEDVSRGLAELDLFMADQAPRPVVPLHGGETKRVERLRKEVAEAHLLADLQDDDTPFQLDTDKVRKRRRQTWEAARLHQLAQDPAALAWRDAKVRRITTSMTLAAAGIALAVSSIGVQASVAKALDLHYGDLGWWAAFGVEAVLSLPLLAAVGVQAYSAMRDKVVDRKSPEGKRLFRVELVLLSLTLVLNCWPAFKLDGFSLLDLIVHSLGPVAAVISVWVLPTLWKILSDLPAPALGGRWSRGASRGATGGSYRGNADFESGVESGATDPDDIAQKATRVRALIAAGVLPEGAGVDKIRAALKCATSTARQVRDELYGGAA